MCVAAAHRALPYCTAPGMHTNLLDARRAMALVDQTEADATEYGYASFAAAYGYGYGYSPPYPSSVSSAASITPVAPGGGIIPGSRGSGGDRGSGGWEASPRGMGRDAGGGGSLGKGGSLSWAAVDSATLLLRRAKALGVPPLPPNLGAVRWDGLGDAAFVEVREWTVKKRAVLPSFLPLLTYRAGNL